MQPFRIYKDATQRWCIYKEMECFSNAYVALCLSQLLLHKKGEDICVHTLIPAYFCSIAMVISPQNHSKFLADTIGTSLRGLLDDQVICLLQSFIYPKEMMIKRVETPPLLDENAQRFALTEDLQVVPVQQQGVGNQRDPILELFIPPAKEGKNDNILKLRVHKLHTVILIHPDQSDNGLRHAMANMVAAILACPPRSSHLWYHLFASNELNNTHVTGFMVRLYMCALHIRKS